jgi:hypothetical protein
MEAVRQRAMMAMDKDTDGGKFGVKSFSDTMSNGKSMGGSDATMLSESARAKPVGMGSKMDAQAQPDHGKHK